MAYALKSRKRVQVQPPRRGPDGSAFQRCKECGVLMPIALSDMHKCAAGGNGRRERSRGGTEGLGITGQPRSAFRFFMESFEKSCEAKGEVDQRGFHLWKNMPMKQRLPYLSQAEEVNLKYEKVLLEEADDLSQVDDEADSASVGKFDPNYEGTYFQHSHGGKYSSSESYEIYGWED